MNTGEGIKTSAGLSKYTESLARKQNQFSRINQGYPKGPRCPSQVWNQASNKLTTMETVSLEATLTLNKPYKSWFQAWDRDRVYVYRQKKVERESMTNDCECVAYGERGTRVACGLTVINGICDRKLVVSDASIRTEERKSSTKQQNVTPAHGCQRPWSNG